VVGVVVVVAGCFLVEAVLLVWADDVWVPQVWVSSFSWWVIVGVPVGC
jgi:hypothetical protein